MTLAPDTEVVLTVPRLLRVAKVAELLDCSPQTVRRRIADGSLPAVVERTRTMVRSDELREYLERRDGTHTLYVLAGADRVKIGVAQDFAKRLRALQSASPVELEVVRLVRTNRPYRVEAALHAEFRGYRTHGEWFAADPVRWHIEAMSDAEIGRMGQT